MALADLAPVPASAVEIAARPLVAMVAGALIGVERQWHHRAAGIRTHALLAVGAAGFGLIAHLLAVRADAQMNPAQIAAGVVSGIGFLCGGVILHRGGAVQGLTSAASLWTTAGVGLAIGAGYYPLASVLVVAILTVQFPLRWAEDHLGRPSLPPSPSLWLVRMQGSRQAVERLWARCLERRMDPAAVNRVAIRTRREEADVVLVAELSLSDAEALAVVALGEDPGDGIAAVRCTRVAQPREA